MRSPDIWPHLKRSSPAILVLVMTLAWKCAGKLPYAHLPPPLLAMLLASVAMWAALADAPWLMRWSCGYVALWTIWTQAPRADWQVWLAWGAVPHVLLIFSLLSIVREVGFRPAPPTAPPRASRVIAWRFSLVRLLAWVAGAALLSLTFRQVYDYQRELPWPGKFRDWQLLSETAGETLAATVVDLAALWALLRRGRLGWRPAWPVALLAIWCIVCWPITNVAVFGGRPESLDTLYEAMHREIWYLLPLMLLLLVTRARGYRWSRVAPDAAGATGQIH